MTSDNKGLIKPQWNHIQIPLVAGLPNFKQLLDESPGKRWELGPTKVTAEPLFHYEKINASLYMEKVCIYILSSGLVKDSSINRSLNHKDVLLQQSVIVPDTWSHSGSSVYMPINYRVFLQLSGFCLCFGQALMHNPSVSRLWQAALFNNTMSDLAAFPECSDS